MQTAIFSSIILIVMAYVAIVRRPHFWGFGCLKAGGVPKERIVKIEKRLSRKAGIISRKLHNEICIFNRMKIVMLCRNKVPVIYSQFLGKLVIEPRWIYRGNDSVQRFLYICAAANSYAHSNDGLVRRQLVKNCIYVFGQKDIIKKPARNLVRTERNLFLHKRPQFKYISGRFIFEQNRTDRLSYTIYHSKLSDTDKRSLMSGPRFNEEGKHYADKHLPVQCFETTANRFSYFVGADKFNYNLSHTSDTFFAVAKSEAVGIYVPDSVTFGSSICEKGNDLNIYVNSECGKYFDLEKSGINSFANKLKVYVIHGKSKAEITEIVAELKRRRGVLDYLLTSEEAKEVVCIEELFERAWSSRFVRGDKLKQKFASTCKYVPTMFLPSLVYSIEQPDDFFSVADSFKLFRRIAKAVNNLNVILLYSGANDEVREIIKAFADREAARELIADGVFLFFVDRISIESDAVNYFSLMSEPISRIKTKSIVKNKAVEITTHISNSFPITHTVYVRNTVKQPQSARVSIQLSVGSELENLPFGMAATCKRHIGFLQVTSLKSGRSSSYKLPSGASVTDELGREIGEGETACDSVFIGCDVKLAGFEEKVLKIIKGEGELSRTARKEAFLGSLESVKIKGNIKLQRLFEISITEGTDEKLCCSLKDAVKNFDRDVFFALLQNREKISADIYSLLIERVIGIKLLRGKIQLMPCISITGSFELSFIYKGVPYSFKVVERGSGFSINYGDTEYKNFLQVAIN